MKKICVCCSINIFEKHILKNCYDLSDLWKRSKNTFLEIAKISLISEKEPRIDAIALKKKMHSDLCLL
jgi:hypothetical protein